MFVILLAILLSHICIVLPYIVDVPDVSCSFNVIIFPYIAVSLLAPSRLAFFVPICVVVPNNVDVDAD